MSEPAAETGVTEIPVPLGERTAKPHLAEALAAFQAEIPRVVKGSKALIAPRDSAAYSYDYADLGAVTENVLPVLGRHGLSFLCKPTWVSKDGGTVFCLIYKLMHTSGEQEVGLWPLPAPDRAGPQQLGSAISYARRYAFQAVTGVAPAPGEDDDAASAQEGPRPEAAPNLRHADQGQKRRIRNRLTEMGIPDEDDIRLGWVSGLLGAHTESLDELSRENAATVLDALKPADRNARNEVIVALDQIGISDQADVLGKLTEWTTRGITTTADLCMAEAASAVRRAHNIAAEKNRQDVGAEAPHEPVSPDVPAAGE